MSAAHEATSDGPAHESIPPGKRRRIRIDQTGMSADWRVVGALLGALGLSGAGHVWSVFGVVTVPDAAASAKAHNGNEAAHEPMQTAIEEKVAAKIKEEVKPVKDAVDANTGTIGETKEAMLSVKNGFYEQRAVEEAYRAVDQLPQTTQPRRRLQVYETVKSRAKKNQEEGDDIRLGLDSYFREP